MTVRLQSESLSVSISSSGAEVTSAKNTKGLEYIWQADKTIWPRHAPVLFPIVGKLKDNRFIFNEASFELGQHGFARDKEFALVKEDPESCTFQLTSDEQSKKIYPFDFIFQINYRLHKNTLWVDYTVLNPGVSTLYFSVGAHPGFNCPLLPGETFNDYYLEFENDTYEQTLLSDGLRSDHKKKLTFENKRLFLDEHLFDFDALVFENSQVDKISLRSLKSPHRIDMESKAWPYFGIWSKKGCSNFVCLEPWYGIADSERTNQRLKDKDGILELEPAKEFNCGFSVTFS
jgi:galactose mutarotase-like enzyme